MASALRFKCDLRKGAVHRERGRGERSPSSSPFFSFGIQAGAKNDKRKISGRRGSAGARLRKSGTRLAAARAAASARLFLLRASPCRRHFLPSSLPVPPHQTECVPLRRGGNSHSVLTVQDGRRRTTTDALQCAPSLASGSATTA